MSQSANYEQSWQSAGSTHIKTEPQNSDTTFDPIDIKSNNNNNNNNNTMMLSTAVSQRNSDSNPTSPHSVGSDESVVNHPNLYYNETIHSLLNGANPHRPLGFDPLTPPGYPNACLRSVSNNNMTETMLPTTPSRRFAKTEVFNSTSLTPPMDRTPPKSPKFRSDASEKDCTDLENGSISGDDSKSLYSDYNQEISSPKVNSHGKVKTHKCKHCSYVGFTKKDFWEHTRSHIKPERQILCTKCPFVTEFKHHYEYHLRNHEGKKPFKCPDCSYSCVNKSMLNSHLKSHSDVYQYRCENCTYATKYVHSLKLHLRKYEHEPAVPLDPEGIPDATPVIDVYGTRRGPKKRGLKTPGKRESRKQNKIKIDEESPQLIPPPQTNQVQNMAQSQPPPMPNLPNLMPPFLQNAQNIPNIPNIQNIANMYLHILQQQALAQMSPNQFYNGARNFENMDCNEEDAGMTNANGGRLNDINTELESNHPESPTSSVPNSNTSLNNSHLSKICDDDHQMQHNSPFDAPKTMNTFTPKRCSDVEKSPDNGTIGSSNSAKTHHCKFCGISFQDAVLHTIHMGYHGFKDPFTCNMCGEKCSDHISFFLHIGKNQHE